MDILNTVAKGFVPRRASASGPSPLLPLIEKLANDEYIKLDNTQITPWAFFHAGPLRVNDFYGRTIAYSGIRFEGSPQTVFWRDYIEPFLKDIAFRAVDFTLQQAKDRAVDARGPLREVQGQLHSLARRAYDRMALVEHHLRSRQVDTMVPLRNTDNYRLQIERFIDKRIDAELRAIRPPTNWARMNQWHKENPLLVWSIGLAVAVVLGVLRLTH